MDYSVSIVVPVYNTEPWMLQQCFTSVIEQSYPVNELIIVDDGSDKKETLVELELWALNYPTIIKLIKNSHGGIAKARNTGMEEVTSTFLCFLDSDDFYDSNFIELLISEEKKRQVDIVFCGYQEVNYRGNRIMKKYPDNIVLKDKKKYPYYTCGCGFKMFSVDFLKQNSITFPTGCILEDEAFSSMATIRANRISAVSEHGYNLRQRNDSTSRNRRNFNSSTAAMIPFDHFSNAISAASQMSKFKREMLLHRLINVMMTSNWIFCCYSNLQMRIEMTRKTAGFIRSNIPDALRHITYSNVPHEFEMTDCLAWLFCFGIKVHLEYFFMLIANLGVKAYYKISGK